MMKFSWLPQHQEDFEDSVRQISIITSDVQISRISARGTTSNCHGTNDVQY